MSYVYQNKAFILNLTTAYNMDNYMLWFVPYIQSNHILDFRQMSKQLQIVQDDDSYYRQAKQKFLTARNLWHFYLKREDVENSRLKIIIVCKPAMFNHNNSNKKIIKKLVEQLKEVFSEDERKKVYLNFVFLFNENYADSEILIPECYENISVNFTKNLLDNKELIFNYIYKAGSNVEMESCFNKLSIFLCSIINWFGIGISSSEQRILSQDSNHFVYTLTDIELNDVKVKKLSNNYSRLFKTIDDEKQRLIRKKYDYNKVSDNRINDLKNSLSIDEKLKQQFLTCQNLHKNVPFFYSKKLLKRQEDKLQLDLFKTLENDIEVKNNEIIRNFFLKNPDLGEEPQSNSIEEIRVLLQNYQELEKQSKLESNIDHQRFEKAKMDWSNHRKELRKIYFQQLKLLPETIHICVFSIIFFPLLFLSLQPLHRFLYFETSLLPFTIVATLMIVIGIAFLLYFRNKVKKVYNQIFQNNNTLIIEFKLYIEKLKELAIELYRGQARRKNLQTLQNIVHQHNQHYQKLNFYLEEFCKNLDFDEDLKIDMQRGLHTIDYQFDLSKDPFLNQPILQYSQEKVEIVVDNTDLNISKDQAQYNSSISHFGLISKLKFITQKPFG